MAQTLRRPDMTRIGDTKNETTSIKEGEEDFLCPICLESSASSSLPIKTLNCFHSFHTSCIDQWIQNDPRCPICRGDIVWPSPPITKDGDAQSYVKLFLYSSILHDTHNLDIASIWTSLSHVSKRVMD